MVRESLIRVGPLRLEWAVALRELPEETRAGDRHGMIAFPGGILAAAVDGLGHGPDAADAAERAVGILEKHAGEPVTNLVLRCHTALERTRGAVLALASFNAIAYTFTWVAVGSVHGVLLRGAPHDRSRSYLVPSPGVVGSRLSTLRPTVVPVERGDVVCLATDGVETAFAESVTPTGTPRRIAESVLAEHARRTDEALILVARCLEPTHERWHSTRRRS